MLDALRAIAFAALTAIWPAGLPRTADAEPIIEAMTAAVAADPSPALGSHEEDVQAGVLTAYLESGMHAHAEGDCIDAERKPMAHGYARPEDVPAWVLCRAHGAWQQWRGGTGTLADQARRWLAELHRSAAECPAHPFASMASGGRGCSRGTRLSDWRMARLRKLEVAQGGE